MLAVMLITAADVFTAIHAQDTAQVKRLLAKDPGLANAHDEKGSSAVGTALALQRKEGFVPREQNHVLDAILAAKPDLSPLETCAVGSGAEVKKLADAQFVQTFFKNGWTPLHAAAFGDNAAAAEVLLDAGADVNAKAKNRFENTPLQVALLTQSRKVAQLLIRRGAAVNAVQAEGITALHEAAQSGDVAMIRILLEAGADRAVTAGGFGTPHDLAVKAGHEEAARLLAP
jgi:ankyrin repeat protein